jgi:hypothetical protein
MEKAGKEAGPSSLSGSRYNPHLETPASHPVFPDGHRLTTARRRTAASSANRYFGHYPEAGTHPVGNIIDCNVLGFFVKILIDEHSEAVYLVYVIRFFRFVQNHRQRWTSSAAGLKKNSDRGDLLFLEILPQNVLGFF